MKQDLLEQNPRLLRNHEQNVADFLRGKNLNKKTVSQPHANTYSQAKQYSKKDIVSNRDRKQLNKFCRSWIVQKGAVKQKHLTAIQNMLKYYTQKERNAQSKALREQLRPNSIKQ